MTQTDWQTRLTHRIAQQVRKRRDELNMTAEDLSDETDRLGMRIERTVIANLENRRRASISIAEVLVLAKALRIPPVILLLPVGEDPSPVEVLPGKIASAWAAARWITGEGAFAADDAGEDVMPDDLAAWETSAANLDRYRKHDECVRGLLSMLRRINNPILDASATARERRLWGDGITSLERVIREMRETMRRDGLLTPQLPAKLLYIDVDSPQSGGESGADV